MPALRVLVPPPLAAFVEILACGSISEAGRRMHMTQSAVSKRLRALEQGLGVALIERDARPLRATDAGERLLAYAAAVRALQDELARELSGHVAAPPPASRQPPRLDEALALIERARSIIGAIRPASGRETTAA